MSVTIGKASLTSGVISIGAGVMVNASASMRGLGCSADEERRQFAIRTGRRHYDGSTSRITNVQHGEPLMAKQVFRLDREFIELNVLLKLLALASSGGAAKAMVAEGLVTVDGEVETRKTRKLRVGHVVRVADEEIQIAAAEA
ncbi:MAG: RNA-binding S4 domain-containing protein [Rhodocyclaceae bacterium]